MPTKPSLFAMLILAAVAAALPGCGGPEGLGSIDVDAGRQTLLAQGRPDPLALAGRPISQVAPQAPKKPARPAASRRR